MIAWFAKKPPLLVFLSLSAFCLLLISPILTHAQKRRLPIKIKSKTQTIKRAAPVAAIVIDERLAVLRFEPSLMAVPLERMRTGRAVQIVGERDADGVKFYQVQVEPEKSGWVQSEAVASKFKKGDDGRLARLIQASEDFDQIERATVFIESFPDSIFRPAILLLVGDLLEEHAAKLTRDAVRRLDQSEMQANGAPVHSYFMNFAGLDRYRKLGANFVFDQAQKQFHYDGATWREIMQKYPESSEGREAAKRLQNLTAVKIESN